MADNTTKVLCPQDVLHLLEYSSQVGEAFRPTFGSKFTRLTYYLSTSFVTVDTMGKYKKIRDKHNGNADKVLTALSDMFLWRMMASIFFPGIIIRTVCGYTGYRLACSKILPDLPILKNVLTTCIGLSTIPLIVRPVDNLSDAILDCTLRAPCGKK